MTAQPALAELHDDLFWTLQCGAERTALIRSQINRLAELDRERVTAGERPIYTEAIVFLEDSLAEDTARQNRLADLAVLLFRLIPRQAQFCDLVAQMADRGYFRDRERQIT